MKEKDLPSVDSLEVRVRSVGEQHPHRQFKSKTIRYMREPLRNDVFCPGSEHVLAAVWNRLSV